MGNLALFQINSALSLINKTLFPLFDDDLCLPMLKVSAIAFHISEL